jgi:hypothetical protein
MNFERYCDCEGWVSSWDRIVGVFTFAGMHGFVYRGRIFEFCPWCSKPLKKRNVTGEFVKLEEKDES